MYSTSFHHETRHRITCILDEGWVVAYNGRLRCGTTSRNRLNLLYFNGSTKLIVLHINGNERCFEETAFTVAQLVGKLGLEGKRLAIERNGEIVSRGVFAETQLTSGDKLEIVGAVGGG